MSDEDPKHIYLCPGCDRYFYMIDPEHDGFVDYPEVIAHKLRGDFVGEMVCQSCSSNEIHASIRATEYS
jgi:uncharacterized protein YlaI